MGQHPFIGLSTVGHVADSLAPTDVPVGSGCGTRLIATSTARRGERAGGSVTDHDDGSFEPKLVAKHQRRLPGVEDLVIWLSAKGLTTGEIGAHLGDGLWRAGVKADDLADHRPGLEGMAKWQPRPQDAGAPGPCSRPTSGPRNLFRGVELEPLAAAWRRAVFAVVGPTRRSTI